MALQLTTTSTADRAGIATSNARQAYFLRMYIAVSLFLAAVGSAAAQVSSVPAVPSCPMAKLPPTDPIEQQRIKRLVALSKVWGKVKFFHPSLAYKRIDWDAALMAAIPKVSAARDAQAFADAVKEMLATLGDPASAVVEHARPAPPSPMPTDPHPIGHLTADGVLVVSMTNYADLNNLDATKRLRDLAKRLAEATAVVVDLRDRAETSPKRLSMVIDGTLHLVGGSVDTTVAAPGRRRRLYMGFPSQTEMGYDPYFSYFLVVDGKTFPAAPAAQSRPIVFVINRGSTVPEIALALQDAGKAAIVLDGYAGEEGTDLSEPLSVHLEGPFSAQVRSSELVWSDGTGGFSANLVVAPVTASEGKDLALDAALRLAREFKVGRPMRSRVPGHGTLPREASYPDLASLSLEHRLLAAFRMHNVVQHFFPYRDIMGEDWDQVLGEFIPRFEAADAVSYSLCVAEMWTRIHDSHGTITDPHFLQYFGSAGPPLRVRWIEGAVVIDQILDPLAVEPTGLKVGDVVLSVDGEEIAQRMARMGRYIPASTPQAHRRDICVVLLGGAPGTAARLRIRNASGEEREVKIARSMQRGSPLARTPRRTGQPLRWLSDNIGYADLERLKAAQVDDLFSMFAGAKAIVFDVRGYPEHGPWEIARRLTDRTPAPAVLIRQPRVSADSSRYGTDALGDVTEVLDFVAAPPLDRPVFRGLTVLLINEYTQSLGEHVGLFLKAANGTAWIGGASAGAHGDVTELVVPGGIRVPFTGQAMLHPDGRQLQRIGLTPDVEVHPTIAGVRAGRDEVLEVALATIQKRLTER
jgi:C-terminal processing protease CtpA/Prc/rhodanese-related sulfurtransferase